MSSLLLITVAAVLGVVFSVAGVWFGRIIVRQRGDGHHEVLGTLPQTGGTMHAVFLAFLVGAVWQSYDAAGGNVAEEASSLTAALRQWGEAELYRPGEQHSDLVDTRDGQAVERLALHAADSRSLRWDETRVRRLGESA